MTISLFFLLWACSYVIFLWVGINKSGLEDLNIGDLVVALPVSLCTFPAIIISFFIGIFKRIKVPFCRLHAIVVWRRDDR